MRYLFYTSITVVLCACVVTTLPSDQRGWRLRRSADIIVKSTQFYRIPGVKGVIYRPAAVATTTRKPLYPGKGQYICGNKLCELPVGFKACEDCQYKIA